MEKCMASVILPQVLNYVEDIDTKHQD